MIEYLKGTCIKKKPSGVVVFTSGVGYGVDLPLSHLCKIPGVGAEIELWIYTHVREDSLRLFGFLAFADRELFEILLGVSGVGPKLGLAILSTLTAESVGAAVSQSNSKFFESVPGVGKRMAEKLIMELRPKQNRLATIISSSASSVLHPVNNTLFETKDVTSFQADAIADVESALENLGFKALEISQVLSVLGNRKDAWEFNDLLKEALASLSGREKVSSPAEARSSHHKAAGL